VPVAATRPPARNAARTPPVVQSAARNRKFPRRITRAV